LAAVRARLEHLEAQLHSQASDQPPSPVHESSSGESSSGESSSGESTTPKVKKKVVPE